MTRVIVTRDKQLGEANVERPDAYDCTVAWVGREGHCDHCGSRLVVEARDFNPGQRCVGSTLVVPCPRFIGGRHGRCPGNAYIELPPAEAQRLGIAYTGGCALLIAFVVAFLLATALIT